VYIKQEEGKTGNVVPDRNAFSCSTMNNQRRETGVWQMMGGDQCPARLRTHNPWVVFSWFKMSKIFCEAKRLN
jgi:hypothetical protein